MVYVPVRPREAVSMAIFVTPTPNTVAGGAHATAGRAWCRVPHFGCAPSLTWSRAHNTRAAQARSLRPRLSSAFSASSCTVGFALRVQVVRVASHGSRHPAYYGVTPRTPAGARDLVLR